MRSGFLDLGFVCFCAVRVFDGVLFDIVFLDRDTQAAVLWVVWRIDESVYFGYTLVLVFYWIGARFLSVIFELFLSVFFVMEIVRST